MTRPEEDGARRVIQCACGWARRWLGRALSIEHGWHVRYRLGPRGLVLSWTCQSCYVPPPPAPASSVSITVPEGIRRVVERDLEGGNGTSHDAAEIRRMIERLCEIDPLRGHAYLVMVLDVIGDSQKLSARRWAAFTAGLGMPRRKKAASLSSSAADANAGSSEEPAGRRRRRGVAEGSAR